jgi:DNA modification methylase
MCNHGWIECGDEKMCLLCGQVVKEEEQGIDKFINQIIHGDCLETLKTLPDNSVDSIVTDPPYELGFMGKKWDSTGIAYNVDLWKECLRVLKPGGHLLAFGGTRTYHRMACAIEDAGFEIRDCIQWLYGCLDEATEVLTNNGWKKYFELSPEDEVLQWDSKTSELSWTKPSKIHTYPYEGKMYHFANRHTDQLLTPNHRVYGKFRRHSRSPKPDVFEVVEAQHIKQHWLKDLPVAGLYKGNKHVDESYAYLVGWWLTDAWAHQDGKACMFSQSKPDTLLKLREALSKFDCSFSEYTKAPSKDTQNAEHTFYVTGSLANKLLDEFPTRELNISMLEWDIDSRKALLEGLLDGDGTYRDGQHCVVFWSKKKERLDLVQLLAMSLNYRTLIDYKKGCVHINPKTNTTQLQHRHTHDIVDYKGDVWCVTVPKGAFVVRRNGKVFITGNSGFPKSHDISKAIDKNLGAKRDVIGVSKGAGKNPKGFKFDDKSQSGGHLKSEYNLTTPATPEAKQWSGWGTCLKPANEPLIWATKSLTPVLEDGIIFLENILGVILCQLLNAKYVEQILMSNLQGSPEDVFDFVLWIVEEKITNGKEKQSPKMDIFKSRETERIFWNIVTLWRNISEENFQLGNMSTISMETNKITELKILKSWVLESIFQNTTLANECSVDGLMSYATSVVMNSNEGKLKSKHILKHSVPENAILKIGVNVALELVNFAVWSLTTLIQTENTVLPNVITLPEWERVVKEKLLSVDFVDRNLKQLFQETLNTVIESVCQEPSPANEPIVLARKPLSEKTIAENVMKWGTGGLNIDGCRIGTEEIKTYGKRQGKGVSLEWSKYTSPEGYEGGIHQGRFPANVILDEEAGALLDQQSGSISYGNKPGGYSYSDRQYAVQGFIKDCKPKAPSNYGDSGGASRFFYCAKASKKERGEGNNHPTVKPVKLIEYLITLVTPPNGTVLDPFFGSGTTGIAAVNLGFNYIGVELEEQYVEIARRRIGGAE